MDSIGTSSHLLVKRISLVQQSDRVAPSLSSASRLNTNYHVTKAYYTNYVSKEIEYVVIIQLMHCKANEENEMQSSHRIQWRTQDFL